MMPTNKCNYPIFGVQLGISQLYELKDKDIPSCDILTQEFGKAFCLLWITFLTTKFSIYDLYCSLPLPAYFLKYYMSQEGRLSILRLLTDFTNLIHFLNCGNIYTIKFAILIIHKYII